MTPGGEVLSGLPAADTVESALARHRLALAFKRVLDFAASLVLLACLLPLMLLVAAAIQLDSPGGALFSQMRSGRRGRAFRCYKFRSMVSDHGRALPPEFVQRYQQGGRLLKTANDPRVTRVGAVLRRLSLDELPQLWNVLKGDMSLVGPRPLMEHMLEPYPEFRAVRSMVRPGITGLWQVREREHNDSALHMVAHDVEYVTDFTLARDVRILLATLVAVVWGRGAL